MRRALPLAAAVMLSGMVAAPFLPSAILPAVPVAAVISKVPDMRKIEAQTAINLAIQEADSLASRATFYGLENSAIVAEFDSILRRMNRNGRAPEWARQYVRGYWRAIRESWWRTELESAIVSPDGTRYTANKQPDAGCVPFPASAYAEAERPDSPFHGWQKWESVVLWRGRPGDPSRAGRLFEAFKPGV